MSRLGKLIETFGLESEEAEIEVPSQAPVEDALETQEQENGEIEQSEVLADQLDVLADNAEAAPDSVALEHYHWMFETLLKNAGLGRPKSVALENFTNTGSGLVLLSRGIRDFNRKLRVSIATAKKAYKKKYS